MSLVNAAYIPSPPQLRKYDYKAPATDSFMHRLLLVRTPTMDTDRLQEATEPIQKPPLLRLAPELRNMIWRYSLSIEGPVNLRVETIASKSTLLDTCAQIRNEASEMFWS